MWDLQAIHKKGQAAAPSTLSLSGHWEVRKSLEPAWLRRPRAAVGEQSPPGPPVHFKASRPSQGPDRSGTGQAEAAKGFTKTLTAWHNRRHRGWLRKFLARSWLSYCYGPSWWSTKSTESHRCAHIPSDGILLLKGKSETPWLKFHWPYTGLVLHPQQLLQDDSPFPPLALALGNWNQQWALEAEQMVSSFPDRHGAALLPPRLPPSLAEVTLRKQSLGSLSPWPPQLTAETPTSPGSPQKLSSTWQQLSNPKAELNLSPFCLQQAKHVVFQRPWAESSYLMGRADFNAACSLFIQWLTVDLSKNEPDGSRDKWSALLEFLKQKKTDACVPLARTHLKLRRWVQMLREVVFRGFSPSRLSS